MTRQMYAVVIAVLLLCGCSGMATGWRLPFDQPPASAEKEAWLSSRQLLPPQDDLFPALLGPVPGRQGSVASDEPVIIVTDGVPVNKGLTALSAELVSDEIRSLGADGINFLTDSDELLCISFRKGKTEWFALFAQFQALPERLQLKNPAVFVNRARCVERYKSRRHDQVSVRQMDWVINRLDQLNEELANATQAQSQQASDKK